MWSTGINRNIVECKVLKECVVVSSQGVLIETLWNVKYATFWLTSLATLVLIETLWNVKLLTADTSWLIPAY